MTCAVCGGPLPTYQFGRPRIYCDAKCRKVVNRRAYRRYQKVNEVAAAKRREDRRLYRARRREREREARLEALRARLAPPP